MHSIILFQFCFVDQFSLTIKIMRDDFEHADSPRVFRLPQKLYGTHCQNTFGFARHP